MNGCVAASASAIALAALACTGCGSAPTAAVASPAASAGGGAASPNATREPNPAIPSQGPAPGHWELVLEVDDLPGKGKLPSQTMTMCSTPEDKKQWQEMVGGRSAAGCTIGDYQAAGATISYTVRCGGGIEGRTTIRSVDADHYAGETMLTFKGGAQPAVIRSRVSARRLSQTCGK